MQVVSIHFQVVLGELWISTRGAPPGALALRVCLGRFDPPMGHRKCPDWCGGPGVLERLSSLKSKGQNVHSPRCWAKHVVAKPWYTFYIWKCTVGNHLNLHVQRPAAGLTQGIRIIQVQRYTLFGCKVKSICAGRRRVTPYQLIIEWRSGALCICLVLSGCKASCLRTVVEISWSARRHS